MCNAAESLHAAHQEAVRGQPSQTVSLLEQNIRAGARGLTRSHVGGCCRRYINRSLIESLLMPQRIVFRLVLPAIVGLMVGFLALAFTVPSESTMPVPLVSLFSPGLKIAELVMPAAHESLAWTFGWFLRIAIGVNAAFYFAIFALLAYVVDRRRFPAS